MVGSRSHQGEITGAWVYIPCMHSIPRVYDVVRSDSVTHPLVDTNTLLRTHPMSCPFSADTHTHTDPAHAVAHKHTHAHTHTHHAHTRKHRHPYPHTHSHPLPTHTHTHTREKPLTPRPRRSPTAEEKAPCPRCVCVEPGVKVGVQLPAQAQRAAVHFNYKKRTGTFAQ